MALLFVDGFDHIGTLDLTTGGKWASGSSSATANTPSPRTGTHRANHFLNSGNAVSKVFATSGGVVMGCAFFIENLNDNGNGEIFRVLEGATIHLTVGIIGGLLKVERAGTTLIGTGITPLLVNNWYYLEFKATIADVGAFELRLDGDVEISNPSVDTMNGGTGVWNSVRVGGLGDNVTGMDDFYLCDTSGPAPWNTFLGPVKVVTLFPQTDAVAVGSNVGLTPSTGTDHGALVDETSPNTSDYNSSDVVGTKDTYQYPPLALTGTVLGVQTNRYSIKFGGEPREAATVLRAGGVDYDLPSVALPTTFGYVTQMTTINPNTSLPWTVADIDALQVGMKVTV